MSPSRTTPARERSAIPVPSLGGLGQLAFLLLLSAVVIAFVSAMSRLFAGAPPPIEEPPRAPRDRGRRDASRGVEPTPHGADSLAAEGRFAEAVHTLLLESIAVLARSARPPESRTSRELLAHFRLDGASREDFAGIVHAVERSRFGGRSLERADYDECRARVERLRRVAPVRAPGTP